MADWTRVMTLALRVEGDLSPAQSLELCNMLTPSSL